MLNGSSFFRRVKKRKLTIFAASLYDINEAIEAKDLMERPLEAIVPKQHQEFLPLLNKVFVDQLPPHHPRIHHELLLNEGETPMWGPLHSMLREEVVVLKEWCEDSMSQGFIRQVSSPFAATVLFANQMEVCCCVSIIRILIVKWWTTKTPFPWYEKCWTSSERHESIPNSTWEGSIFCCKLWWGMNIS